MYSVLILITLLVLQVAHGLVLGVDRTVVPLVDVRRPAGVRGTIFVRVGKVVKAVEVYVEPVPRNKLLVYMTYGCGSIGL